MPYGNKDIIRSYKINELKSATPKRKDFGIFSIEQFVKNIERFRKPHRHDHFSIFFFTGGSGSHVIDFKKYKLRKNRVFLISPGQVHTWNEINNGAGYALFFNKDLFSLTNQSRDLRDFLFYNFRKERTFFDLAAPTSNHIRSLCRKINEEYQSAGNFTGQIIRAYLNILLFELARTYINAVPAGKTQSIPVIKVREFERAVNKNFKTLRTVSDYALLLNITANYLNSICKKITDKQAGEIIRDRILLEAKRLLANTNDSVSEIAYRLNFEDNSYFGRFFKKHSRMTPAKFREKTKQNFG